jgi:hypothetical protein
LREAGTARLGGHGRVPGGGRRKNAGMSGISLVAGGISPLRDSRLAGDEIPIESQRNWLQQANVCNAGGEPLDVAEVAPVIADDDLVDGAHLIARLLFISSSGREALHKTDLSTGASNAGF